jgi:hypothetical protein
LQPRYPLERPTSPEKSRKGYKSYSGIRVEITFCSLTTYLLERPTSPEKSRKGYKSYSGTYGWKLLFVASLVPPREADLSREDQDRLQKLLRYRYLRVEITFCSLTPP